MKMVGTKSEWNNFCLRQNLVDSACGDDGDGGCGDGNGRVCGW